MHGATLDDDTVWHRAEVGRHQEHLGTGMKQTRRLARGDGAAAGDQAATTAQVECHEIVGHALGHLFVFIGHTREG